MTNTSPPQNNPSAEPSPEMIRPREGRMVAGVSAGIADRFNLDVAVVRLGFVALTLFGGSGVVLYLLGWLALRSDDRDRSIAQRWFGNDRSVGKEAAS